MTDKKRLRREDWRRSVVYPNGWIHKSGKASVFKRLKGDWCYSVMLTARTPSAAKAAASRCIALAALEGKE